MHGTRSLRPKACARRGAATVEFALVLPVFLLLLAGMIEFGQAFRIQHSLSTAARSGARSAIVAGVSNSTIVQNVQTLCAQLLGVSSTDVSVGISVNGNINGSLANASNGDSISVTASIPYSKAGVGFFSNTFANSTLKSTCILPHE